jgi:hypothetical protein
VGPARNRLLRGPVSAFSRPLTFQLPTEPAGADVARGPRPSYAALDPASGTSVPIPDGPEPAWDRPGTDAVEALTAPAGYRSKR